MGAPDLLEHLRAVGLTITADGGRLTVTPRDLLTEDLRSTIRENKAALLAALAPAPVSRPAQLNRSFSREADPDLDHGERWTGLELDPQDLTHARLIAMGLDDPEAATLAEWMTLRTDGELVTCYECRHFRARPRTCGNRKAADMPRELGTELAIKGKRCPGFAPDPAGFVRP
ncbi:hypothetical protein [Roseateles sp.]|jgi:hypothetical protein|uniref:TubC N-terminal docking domain-related protein n=1 Tax=Roseateles sp. TaxID=1971397 RepID=UPI003961C519